MRNEKGCRRPREEVAIRLGRIDGLNGLYLFLDGRREEVAIRLGRIDGLLSPRRASEETREEVAIRLGRIGGTSLPWKDRHGMPP